MKKFELFFGIAKIPTDFFMTVIAFILAYRLRLITETLQGFAKPIDYSVLPTINEYLIFSAATAITLITVFALGRLYSLKTTFTFTKETTKVITLWFIWMMLIITYFFFTRTLPFSRLAILYSWGLALIFVIFGRGIIRIIQKIFLNIGIGQRKLIFIGNNKIAEELQKNLQKDKNYKIIHFIFGDNLKNLEKIIKNGKIDEIIQTQSAGSKKIDEEILALCDIHHVSYRFVPDLLEVRRTNINIDQIGGFPIISLKTTPIEGWGKIVKRTVDFIGSIILLIILSPIFLITAIAIKIDTPGPIIFSRLDDGKPVKRVGQYGELFRFYKFRTMKPNTDSLRYTELATQNIRKDGPLVKIANDPRVTKIGYFLRKSSIDELPQLWNVFIGKISLIGPRPHLPEEVARYQKHHRFVLTIKPGITGLAQISGRSDLSFEDEIKLDRFYIENWSLLLDLKILFRTIGVLLRGYRE